MGSLSSQIVEREIATMKQVEEALARQVLYGGDLATNLLEVLGGGVEGALTYVLAEHYALRPAPTGSLPLAGEDVLKLVPSETALRHGFCPLGLEGGALVVAVAEPLPGEVEDDLTFALGLPLIQLAAPLVRIRQALALDYKLPIDRRQLRLLARLDGLPDPSPSTMPPPMPGGGPSVSMRAPRFPAGLEENDPATKRGIGSVPGGAAPAPGAQAALGPATRLVRWMQRAARAAPMPRPKRRRGPMSVSDSEEALGLAETAEETLGIFSEFSSQFFGFSALFVVQGDLAEGRDAHGHGATREQVAGIGVPLDLPSCLSRAKNRAAPVCMPLDKEGLDAQLATDLGRAPRGSVVVVPVVVRGRAVALLYGDDGDHAVELGEVGDVISMASLAASALERVAAQRKRRKQSEASGPRPAEVRRATFTGLAVPSQPSAVSTGGRERKADALARALGIPALDRGGAAHSPLATPGAPVRRVTASFEASVDSAPPDASQYDKGAPTTEMEAIVPGATSDRDASPDSPRLEIVEDDFPDEVPPEEPPHQPRPKAPPVPPLSQSAAASREFAPDGSPNSRSSYHPPREPPSARRVSVLPSIIVDVSADHSRVIEALLSSEDETDALGDVLRAGVTVVPGLLARLPGPLSVAREDLLMGRSRVSAAGPLFRALVALRRSALPFVVVHSANVSQEARMWATLTLGELPYLEAGTALIPRLFDPANDVRRAATTAARLLRSSPDVFSNVWQGLTKIMRASGEKEMRRALAAETLGALVALGAVPALIEAVGSRDAAVQVAATDSLVRITCQDLGEDIKVWDAWWGRHADDERAVWLIDALTHPSDEIRERAAAELRPVVPFDLSRFSSLSEAGRISVQERCARWWEESIGGRAPDSDRV